MNATFVKGATLTPNDQLVRWLDGQQRNGKPKLIRVPVVLRKIDGMYDISKARLGAAADAVEVYANDASLGVGLADRAGQQDGDIAAFLVEGYWRGNTGRGFQLDVRSADALPVGRLATFAEVERE